MCPLKVLSEDIFITSGSLKLYPTSFAETALILVNHLDLKDPLSGPLQRSVRDMWTVRLIATVRRLFIGCLAWVVAISTSSESYNARSCIERVLANRPRHAKEETHQKSLRTFTLVRPDHDEVFVLSGHEPTHGSRTTRSFYNFSTTWNRRRVTPPEEGYSNKRCIQSSRIFDAILAAAACRSLRCRAAISFTLNSRSIQTMLMHPASAPSDLTIGTASADRPSS